MTLGLIYETPPEGMERGMEILRQIAAGDDDLEDTALIAFTGFGDWAMNLLFIYSIRKDADILETQTRVNLAILREFHAEGLEFAFPTQTLPTVRQDPPEAARPAAG